MSSMQHFKDQIHKTASSPAIRFGRQSSGWHSKWATYDKIIMTISKANTDPNAYPNPNSKYCRPVDVSPRWPDNIQAAHNIER